MSDKNLRNKIIRLANENPELREYLLPLLTEKKAKEEFYVVENENDQKFAVHVKFLNERYLGDFEPYSTYGKKLDVIAPSSLKKATNDLGALYYWVTTIYGLFDEGIVKANAIHAFR